MASAQHLADSPVPTPCSPSVHPRLQCLLPASPNHMRARSETVGRASCRWARSSVGVELLSRDRSQRLNPSRKRGDCWRDWAATRGEPARERQLGASWCRRWRQHTTTTEEASTLRPERYPTRPPPHPSNDLPTLMMWGGADRAGIQNATNLQSHDEHQRVWLKEHQ